MPPANADTRRCPICDTVACAAYADYLVAFESFIRHSPANRIVTYRGSPYTSRGSPARGDGDDAPAG